MNSFFCSRCGTKVFFSGKTKPEKCANCGDRFSEASSQPAKKEPPQKKHEYIEDEIPDIKKFEVSVEIDTAKPMTLKDHWLSAAQNEDKVSREKVFLDTESALDQSLNECQQVKESKDVGSAS